MQNKAVDPPVGCFGRAEGGFMSPNANDDGAPAKWADYLKLGAHTH